jgi:hypothetical protein
MKREQPTPSFAQPAAGMSADRLRAIVWLLRIGACLTLAAFPMTLLSVESMAAAHRWLGLGELPRTPIVDYLARSVSALYGFHGVLLLLTSTDPLRFRPLVWYVAAMNIVFGFMLLMIDLHAGLPAWWTAFEGPPVMATGVALGLLNRSPRP